jgi:hypothetical protein
MILDYIVCDDIRFELNNKFTLVGAYNDRIEFIPNEGAPLVFPLAMPLAFFIRVLPEGNSVITDIQIDFYSNRKHVNSSRMKLLNSKVEINRPLVLPVLHRLFTLEKGEMNFTVSFFNGEQLLTASSPSKSFYVTVRGEE